MIFTGFSKENHHLLLGSVDFWIIVFVVSNYKKPRSKASKINKPYEKRCEIAKAVDHKYLIGIVYVHRFDIRRPVLRVALVIGQAKSSRHNRPGTGAREHVKHIFHRDSTFTFSGVLPDVK